MTCTAKHLFGSELIKLQKSPADTTNPCSAEHECSSFSWNCIHEISSEKWLFRLVIGLVLLTAVAGAAVALVRSADQRLFMLQGPSHSSAGRSDFRPVPPEQISPTTVAGSHRLGGIRIFPTTGGFDRDEIQRALDDYQEGGRLRGAQYHHSAIGQEPVFCGQNKAFFGKASRAWFTVWLGGVCHAQSAGSLDIYLNIVELDEGVYGGRSWSSTLFRSQCQRLDASPGSTAGRSTACPPSATNAALPEPDEFLQQRQRWILGRCGTWARPWVALIPIRPRSRSASNPAISSACSFFLGQDVFHDAARRWGLCHPGTWMISR